jgi:hypothetical protein
LIGKCVVEIDTDPGTSGRAIEESTTYVFCIAKPREVDWTDLKRLEAKDLGFYPTLPLHWPLGSSMHGVRHVFKSANAMRALQGGLKVTITTPFLLS